MDRKKTIRSARGFFAIVMLFTFCWVMGESAHSNPYIAVPESALKIDAASGKVEIKRGWIDDYSNVTKYCFVLFLCGSALCVLEE